MSAQKLKIGFKSYIEPIFSCQSARKDKILTVFLALCFSLKGKMSLAARNVTRKFPIL